MRPNDAYLALGHATRSAIALGLDRNQVLDGTSFTIHRLKVTFWTLYSMERSSCLFTGRQLAFRDDQIDWELFEARERNGFYDFKALLATIVLVEIPWQIGLFTLAFFCSYWTIGFANTPQLAGFIYFMYLLFSLFCNSFCYLMAALFPDETSAGYANSLFWVVLMMFSGVVVPHDSLNDFYRPWIYWADPMRYFFGATISTVLHGVKEVQCLLSDMALFDPPQDQTCEEYLHQFAWSWYANFNFEGSTEPCLRQIISVIRKGFLRLGPTIGLNTFRPVYLEKPCSLPRLP